MIEVAYPAEFGVHEVTDGGDIILRFADPASRFGPVHIVLVADDASSLASALDAAVRKSDKILADELDAD